MIPANSTTDTEFKSYRLDYTMRFIRNIILSTAFLYILFGLMRTLAGNGVSPTQYSLRVGIVIFILAIYVITYTEMFKQNYEYILAVYVIVNSATLLSMAVLSAGMQEITSHSLSLMPVAMIMLIMNYMLPMQLKVAAVSGAIVSMPYLCVSICGGVTNHIITTLMMLVTVNTLMSLNSHANEKMIGDLWQKQGTINFITDRLVSDE